MNIDVDITNNHQFADIPSSTEFSTWALAALCDQFDDVELSICLVNEEESAEFNERYRHKPGPTNILSFPLDIPDGVELDTMALGDLIICVPLMVREAEEQGKDLRFHWAHLVIHGVLHLQGYDHETASDADEMESLEVDILRSLGFPHPYLIEDNNDKN